MCTCVGIGCECMCVIFSLLFFCRLSSLTDYPINLLKFMYLGVSGGDGLAEREAYCRSVCMHGNAFWCVCVTFLSCSFQVLSQTYLFVKVRISWGVSGYKVKECTVRSMFACMYMYVCMYVCMCICVCVCMCV